MVANGLEARWDDLVDFVQKGRYLCIYQKGTDGLQAVSYTHLTLPTTPYV